MTQGKQLTISHERQGPNMTNQELRLKILNQTSKPNVTARAIRDY